MLQRFYQVGLIACTSFWVGWVGFNGCVVLCFIRWRLPIGATQHALLLVSQSLHASAILNGVARSCSGGQEQKHAPVLPTPCRRSLLPGAAWRVVAAAGN